MTAGCKIIVFAKAPVAGQVKTRLAVAIGAERAAQLAARMLDETVAHAVDAGGAIELCCAPDCAHPSFIGLRDRYGITLASQGDGDLGMRMRRALQRAMTDHAGAVLIGTDAPRLDADVLRAAVALLQSAPVVFGPASDGGYVLVGITRAAALAIPTLMPMLFQDFTWSTPQVMAQTRARLAALAITCVELPTLDDVDEPADLIHVPDDWWQ